MALSTTAVFPQTPKTAGISFAAASQSTEMDPATVAPTILLTAGADGALVTSIKYFGEVTITAQKIVLWVQLAGAGNWFIVDEKLQAAYTMATTTAQTAVTFINKTAPNEAIRLAASDKLGITHHVDLQGIAYAEYTNF